MGETLDVVDAVLPVHLDRAHERERLGNGHRDLPVTLLSKAHIHEAEEEVHATRLRIDSSLQEAQERGQIAVDGVLGVSGRDWGNDRDQRETEGAHVHEADDNEDEEQEGEAHAENELHVRRAARSHVEDTENKNDPAPHKEALEVRIDTTPHLPPRQPTP